MAPRSTAPDASGSAAVHPSTQPVRTMAGPVDGQRPRSVPLDEGAGAREVWYVAHPLAPTPEQIAAEADHPEPATSALMRNLNGAMRWLAWLRRSFSETTFIAPWIAAIYSGENDSDPRQREAGLVEADAVIPRLTGIVACGGRWSSGMVRERGVARRVVDLTGLGFEAPRTDGPMLAFEDWIAAEGLEAP